MLNFFLTNVKIFLINGEKKFKSRSKRGQNEEKIVKNFPICRPKSPKKVGKRGQNGEKIVKKYLNLSTKTIKKWVWKGTKFEPKARTSSKFYFGKSGSEKGRSSSRRRELRLSSILVYFGPTFLTVFRQIRKFFDYFFSFSSLLDPLFERRKRRECFLF